MATALRCRTRSGILLLSVLRSFTHTHTHTHTHKLRLFHLSSCLSVLFLPSLLLSSPLLSVCFSLSLSIRFCLVFFVYIFLHYITISFYHFYPPSPSAFLFSTSFSLFLPPSFYSIPSGILRLHPSSLLCCVFLSFLPLFLLLHSNISSNHPLLFVPFFPFLSFRLSSLPLSLVCFSSFSNFFITYTFQPF